MARHKHTGRTELRVAAIKRLADAWALWETSDVHARGAGYLAGYAVECQLKVIAMEMYDCWNLEELSRRMRVDPAEFYTHGLESLFARLPLYNRFRVSPIWSDFAKRVNQWRVEWRYDPRDGPGSVPGVF